MRFSRLAEFFARIEGASDRLGMTSALAELLNEAAPDEADKITYMCQGQLAPPFKAIETGLSEKLVIRVLSDASGKPTKHVESQFKESGDLGLVAASLLNTPGTIEVLSVHEELLIIASTSGKGSQQQKVNLLASLLRACSASEALYAVRLVLGKLRLGIGDPTVMDALAHIAISKKLELPLQDIPPQALNKTEKLELFARINKSASLLAEVDSELKPVADGDTGNESKRATLYFQRLLALRKAARATIETAYNHCSDLGLVAGTYKRGGIDAVSDIHITVGYPVRMALCERLPSAEAIIQKMGQCAVEAKYDGLRLQIHVHNGHVEIFSRNLERLTHMFPEITAATLALDANTLIMEGEAIAVNESTGELLPFQVTIKRRRKHDINDMTQDIPLKFYAFELLHLDGEDYTNKPYTRRRQKLESIVSGSPTIVPAIMFQTSDPAEINAHFSEFVETGLEGIVAKRLDSTYSAGARDFNWIKLKRSYRGELADSVDLCIVGYFLGKGSRARFGLGALLGAVYDPADDTFKTVSKIGTGFTEQLLAELKATLDTIALDHAHPRVSSLIEPDVWVTPRYVITVTADEITRSPLHTAGASAEGDSQQGYALRFPRATSALRTDKDPEDANTVAEIISMAESQKQVKVK